MLRFIVLCLYVMVIAVPLSAQNTVENYRPLLRNSIPIAHIDFQSDGKIITGSSDLSAAGDHQVNGIVRLNTDGTLDQSFRFDVDITQGGAICELFVQDDDKIIVTGQNIFQGITASPILRLNPDGSRDETFNFELTDAGFIRVIPGMDGQYIAISFGSVPSVIRINSDGSVDETFDIGNGFNSLSKNARVLMQEDGKIVFVGSFSSFNDQPANDIVRLNTDGSLDNTFLVGTGPAKNDGSQTFLHSIVEQPDGKILVGGDFDSFNGVATDKIVRLNADGSLDPTFNSSELPGLNWASSIMYLTDGSIVVSDRRNLVKLKSDGTSDDTFEKGNMDEAFTSSFSTGGNVLAGSNGIIYIGGVFTTYNDKIRIGIAALTEDGVLTDFNPHLGAYPIIETVELQSNGKLIVAGEFLNPVTERRGGRIARFNADGTLDTEFMNNIGTGPSFTVNAITSGPENEVYLGGRFPRFNDIPFPGLIRLDPDGTPDNSFRPSITRGAEGIKQILIQGDQLILAGGFETSGIDQLARVDMTSGDIDQNFNSNNPLPLEEDDDSFRNLSHVAVQSDGSILAFGWSPNSNDGGFILRFSNEGVLDETFTTPNLSQYKFTSVAVLPTDEIVFGAFPIEGADSRDMVPLFHLNPNGELISNQAITSLGQSIKAILPVSNTEVIIGGTFDDINQEPINTLAKVSLEGNLRNFNTEMRIFSEINALEKVNEDEFILAGDFGGFRRRAGFSSIAKMTLNNQAPVITGVTLDDPLFEDSVITITVNDLTIDDDNLFPNDFRLILETGDNYTVDGQTIRPFDDFDGILGVTVIAFDGNASSEPFTFDLPVVAVNDAPQLNGYLGPTIIDQNESITIPLSDLNVSDVDNTFPDDFTLAIADGDNYSVEGNNITPDTDFFGSISVPMSVNDGELNSDTLIVLFEVDEVLNTTITSDDHSLKVFPNPTTSQLVISFTNPIEITSVQLYSISGARLEELENIKDHTSIRLNVENLPDGLYLLAIDTANGRLLSKIRKE